MSFVDVYGPRLIAMVCQACFILHQYEDAIETLPAGLESNPASERLHVWLAASYARAGLLDDAAWEADQVLLMNPAFSLETIAASYPFKDETDRADFSKALSLAGLR
ncbi:hypothetical protein [Tropicimonas sp. IMCC6043]|uniref:hypothetical protein n=1 Tax=Tropicimonas sp. IMCC6043 TaxID=2510645 RepID=UPI00101B7ED8|nr:hypothetical protein [Tropicimonas sp. IMCC6043]RYH07003.1 hypothetical protein EU800_21890 [Tropicimonas sp. IMCC6043]